MDLCLTDFMGVQIQNGWNVTGLVGVWHTMVNLVNFADLSLHCWYIAILWQSVARAADTSSGYLFCLPTGIVVAGLMASYTAAAVLPSWLQHKEPQA